MSWFSSERRNRSSPVGVLRGVSRPALIQRRRVGTLTPRCVAAVAVPIQVSWSAWWVEVSFVAFMRLSAQWAPNHSHPKLHDASEFRFRPARCEITHIERHRIMHPSYGKNCVSADQQPASSTCHNRICSRCEFTVFKKKIQKNSEPSLIFMLQEQFPTWLENTFEKVWFGSRLL